MMILCNLSWCNDLADPARIISRIFASKKANEDGLSTTQSSLARKEKKQRDATC